MSGYNNIAVGGGYCNEYLPMEYGEQNEKNKKKSNEHRYRYAEKTNSKFRIKVDLQVTMLV